MVHWYYSQRPTCWSTQLPVCVLVSFQNRLEARGARMLFGECRPLYVEAICVANSLVLGHYNQDNHRLARGMPTWTILLHMPERRATVSRPRLPHNSPGGPIARQSLRTTRSALQYCFMNPRKQLLGEHSTGPIGRRNRSRVLSVAPSQRASRRAPVGLAEIAVACSATILSTSTRVNLSGVEVMPNRVRSL
ncbi:hypothetical protein PYCCODRAFT_966391 [Trametes coccinea BRFM310]|uniref:Uncharacterized protein n=1 Tax=Trametes coccinea (strain BRFM310) TaxID=1353009 RepID=A0A1Y2IC41_TRAC3|nr:hypothetical protein PYCCODRAFT_966391 [Trametes coccinea BRFM310]